MEKIKFINKSLLKLIACLSMLIDHTAFIMWRNCKNYVLSLDYNTMQKYQTMYHFMRNVGRIAFPIFCFCLVEGFYRTSSKKKYFLRLFVFAIISEIPFNLAYKNNIFDPNHQNVIFTLLIGFLAITIIQKIQISSILTNEVKVVIISITIAAACFLAYYIKCDYDYKGIISIIAIYLFFYNKEALCLSGAISFAWEPWAILAFIPIYLYNGKKGLKTKYFFYIFYPLHLLILNYLLSLFQNSRAFISV